MQFPDQKIAVMSIQEHNRWFDLVPGGVEKIVAPYKAVKQSLLRDKAGFAQHYRVQPLMYWDKWERFAEKPLRAIASHLAGHWDTGELEGEQPEVIIINRKAQGPDATVGHRSSGGRKGRVIPNLESVAETLQSEFSVEIIDPEEVNPRNMLSRCRSARLMLGQHGAGLTNAFFMRPGASLIEITWPGLATDPHMEIYGPLCRRLGINPSAPALQHDRFSEVNEEAVLMEVKKMFPAL